MGWPQITMIALMAAGFAIHAVKHGERRDNYNMWGAALSAAISSGLLYAGGFFATN